MPDVAAENAIREAIQSLTDAGRPLNSTTVPQTSIDRLEATDPSGNESDRVYAAIGEMVGRDVLSAPSDPWKDWRLP